MLTDVNELAPELGQGAPRSEEVDPFAGYVDYFGFEDIRTFNLPDGKQWLSYKPMNEGDRVRYESMTSRDIRFNRRTDDAAIKVDQGFDRHALITLSVTGWHIVRRNQAKGAMEPVPFSKGSPGANLEQWLKATDPKIVNNLLDEIRKANPWMADDMTVEMIDEEIARLQDTRKVVAEREASGKSS